MKTQIIQLESHDETISVKDKIEWSQTHRVLLIWPRRGKILRDQLDLVFLERHCASLGSQLALVSKDPKVHFHARQTGIPIFKTKLEAQNNPWRRSWRLYQRKQLQKAASSPREIDLDSSPRKENQHSEKSLLGRLGIFTIGVFAVLAIGALLFPSADVRLPARNQWEEHTILVQANAQVTQVHVSGLVPARKVVTNVEKRATLPASGIAYIPNTYATGEVVFTNLTVHSITIPKNTILSTDEENPIRFATDVAVIVPGGLEEEAAVKITALKPGAEGNQQAGEIVTISSSLGADLKVTNPAATTGGTDMAIPAPTANDRETLAQTVTEELEAIALDLIREEISTEDVLLSVTPNIEEIELQRYSPLPGQPGDKLELTMRIQFSALVVSHDDLLQLGQKMMSARQSDAFTPIPETLSVENLTAPIILDDGESQWRLQVRWQNKMVWNTPEITRRLLGQPPSQAKEQLAKEYNFDQPPAISLYPEWWPWLPFLPFRINVEG